MKIPASILKADVGSVGGHTKPTERMLYSVRQDARQAADQGLVLDWFVCRTGDDIAILVSHTRGPNDTDVHQFAWNAFIKATAVA